MGLGLEVLTLLLLLPVLLPLLPLELLLLLAGGVRAARGAALIAADVLRAVVLRAGAHAPSVVDVAARRGERVARDAGALLLLVDPRDGLVRVRVRVRVRDRVGDRVRVRVRVRDDAMATRWPEGRRTRAASCSAAPP